MPKVSVIIPVYNTEKYLRQCLDSVINQTLQDIEIICVNDGSKDNSLKILEEYAQKDSRIKVINQKNSGVSVVRNKSISIAAGEYLYFCDSDDWLELNCLECAYNNAIEKDADILVFAHKEWMLDRSCVDLTPLVLNYIENHDKDPEAISALLTTTWNKIVRASFIKDNDITFRKDFKSSEDVFFYITCLNKDAKIEAITDVLYNYRSLRKGSITASQNMVKTDIDAAKYVLAKDNFKNVQDKYKLIFINKFVHAPVHWYKQPILEKNKQENIKHLKDFKKFLQKNHEESFLQMSPWYREICEIVSDYESFMQKIFSVKNKDKHKVISFFGIKIKLKRKKD